MSVTIKTRDGTETVPVDLLTNNSPVFSRLIVKLGFTEVEIEDFDPDIVRIFLTLIEETELDDIERNQFRELHKLSVSFEIKWLKKRCRNWFSDIMKSFHTYSPFEDYFFLFYESLFIENKLKVSQFTDQLIEKRRWYDLSRFIHEHIYDPKHEAQSEKELDLILGLCAGRTRGILTALIHRINMEKILSKNTKYLLENMNLAICFERDRELYHELFDTLKLLPNLSGDDLKLILELLTDSTKKSFLKEQVTCNTILRDRQALDEREECYETLEDVLEMTKSGEVLNMFGVLDLLVKVTALNPPGFEEARLFVESLEQIFIDNPSRKVSQRYIDMVRSAMASSNHPRKYQGVMLLEMIRGNEKLVTKHDHITFSASLDFSNAYLSESLLISRVSRVLQEQSRNNEKRVRFIE